MRDAVLIALPHVIPSGPAAVIDPFWGLVVTQTVILVPLLIDKLTTWRKARMVDQRTEARVEDNGATTTTQQLLLDALDARIGDKDRQLDDKDRQLERERRRIRELETRLAVAEQRAP